MLTLEYLSTILGEPVVPEFDFWNLVWYIDTNFIIKAHGNSSCVAYFNDPIEGSLSEVLVNDRQLSMLLNKYAPKYSLKPLQLQHKVGKFSYEDLVARLGEPLTDENNPLVYTWTNRKGERLELLADQLKLYQNESEILITSLNELPKEFASRESSESEIAVEETMRLAKEALRVMENEFRLEEKLPEPTLSAEIFEALNLENTAIVPEVEVSLDDETIKLLAIIESPVENIVVDKPKRSYNKKPKV